MKIEYKIVLLILISQSIVEIGSMRCYQCTEPCPRPTRKTRKYVCDHPDEVCAFTSKGYRDCQNKAMCDKTYDESYGKMECCDYELCNSATTTTAVCTLVPAIIYYAV